MKAPPRKKLAPDPATPLAVRTSCSRLSTEHGPAITTNSVPPMRWPPASTTVFAGLKSRLASLYGRVMRVTRSTPGKTSSVSSRSSGKPVPMTPITVRSSPCEIWALRLCSRKTSTTCSTSSAVALGCITAIMDRYSFGIFGHKQKSGPVWDRSIGMTRCLRGCLASPRQPRHAGHKPIRVGLLTHRARV